MRLPFILLVTSWCLMHQLHLSCQSLLVLLDTFIFECDRGTIQLNFFTLVASISNVWRSPGIERKLRNLLESFNLVPESFCLPNLPGRCLRGRWFSIDEVEEKEIAALPFLQVAFKKLFGKNGDDGPATKKRRY